MDKETLRKQIQGFIPFNKEEEKDREEQLYHFLQERNW